MTALDLFGYAVAGVALLTALAAALAYQRDIDEDDTEQIRKRAVLPQDDTSHPHWPYTTDEDQ
jgi:hypothetical protein